MSQIKRLLEFRAAQKKKKPSFFAQGSYKIKRVKKRWIRPKGLHSKMRLHRKGHQVCISKGYKSPSLVRGMISGMVPVVVNTVSQITNLDPSRHGVILSSTSGQKKKTVIVKKAKELGLVLLNVDADKFVKGVEENLSLRKKIRKDKEEGKKEKETEKTKQKDREGKKGKLGEGKQTLQGTAPEGGSVGVGGAPHYVAGVSSEHDLGSHTDAEKKELDKILTERHK